MKSRLLTLAGTLALLLVVGKFYAIPAVAQAVRAALVKNADEPGRMPYTSLAAAFDFSSCLSNCTPGSALFNSFALLPPVPSGKRLIVNHIYGGIFSATLKSISIASAPSLTDYQADKLFYTGPFTPVPSNRFYFDAQVFLTFEPGGSVFVTPEIGTCINCNGYIRASGYLIDATN
jgi:hypothetical protein